MSSLDQPPLNPYEASAESHDPRPRPSSVRYAVLAALCLVALIAYVQRTSIGVAEAQIRADLDLSKTQMGWIMSAFFWSYALLQIPTGLIGQVFGTRRALSAFVALFSAVAGVFSLAAGMPVLLASRVGMGIGQAGTFPCAVNTVAKWIPNRRRSFATGMLGSFMSVGAALGAALTGLLLPLIGWRVTFALFCLPGLVFAAWFYYWFRDRPQEHRAVNREELMLIRATATAPTPADAQGNADARAESTPQSSPLRVSVSISALCAQQVCRAAGYMFFGSWFATYLREARGVEDDALIGILNALPLLAIVVGSPVGGVIADWVLVRTGSRRLSRQGVAAGAMLIACLMIAASYPLENPWLTVTAISVGSFFAAFGGPCSYSSAIDIGGRHTPVVFGAMNMMGNFGAALFPLAVPLLLNEGDLPGSGNWTLVLFTFAGIYLAAAVFWLLTDTSVSLAAEMETHDETIEGPREEPQA